MANLFDSFLERIEDQRPWGFTFMVWCMGICSLSILSRWVDVLSWFFPWGQPEPLWMGVLVGGAVLGVVQYWVGGMLYHLAVLFSGGNGFFKTSQLLNLYAWAPLYLFVVSGMLFLWIMEELQIPMPPSFLLARLGWIGMSLAGVAAVAISYLSVMRLQRTAPLRSALCFIFVPLMMGTVFFEPAQVPFVYPYAQAADAFQRAIYFLEHGEYVKSEYAFQRALDELHPDETDQRRLIFQNLGRLYEDWHRAPEAVRAYTQAMQLAKPNSVEYFNHQGEVALLERNVIEAIKAFEKAIRLDVTNSVAHNQLGLIYLGVFGEGYSDHRLALKHNQAALLDRPQDLSLKEALALNWVALKHYAQALPILEELSEKIPRSAQIKYHLGITYEELGDREQAKAMIRAALRLDPDLMSPHVVSWLADEGTL